MYIYILLVLLLLSFINIIYTTFINGMFNMVTMIIINLDMVQPYNIY